MAAKEKIAHLETEVAKLQDEIKALRLFINLMKNHQRSTYHEVEIVGTDLQGRKLTVPKVLR